MRHTAFDLYHPSGAALYLTAVLVLAMTAFQPVLVALSAVVAFAYNVFLRGWRAALRTLAWQLPLMLIVAVLNGIFSARGSTLLFQIGHQGFFLESFVYGACMGLALVAVMQWFSNLSNVLTSDKIMQLTGSSIPTIGLMVTMVLRLVPQYLRRGTSIRLTQTACTTAKLDESEGSASGSDGRRSTGFFARKAASARDALRDISVLMGWGMEDSLDTAQAMRARGWGAARKRSTYRRSEFRLRDGVLIVILGVAIAASAFLAWVACSQYSFYPQLSQLVPWWGYGVYLLFLSTPFILELKERIAWRR